MISVEHWGYCPFCLATRNSMTNVSVQYTNDGDGKTKTVEVFKDITDVIELITWIEKYRSYRSYRNAIFIIDQYQYAFIPVAIVNGTPVCPMHLWFMTEGK